MGRTIESLNNFNGGQRIISSNEGLAEAVDLLDSMKCTQLGIVLMYHASTRAADVSPAELIEGNQFNQPSSVSMRDFHRVEGVIYDTLPEVEFVDVAPLQPLGTSSKLAGTDQKMIMPALRRSEVNSDATTALFREAYARHAATGDDVRLATNTRITRVQTFDQKSGFLPHFRMFAQVSVGKSEDARGPRELETLADHLASDVAILENFNDLPEGDVTDLDIKIGNVVFIEDLIARGLIDRLEARRRTQDPTFDVLKTAGIELDSPIGLGDEDASERINDVGFKKGAAVVDRFKDIIGERHPGLLPRLTLDLGRVAGIGYYRHLCYKVHATNSNGLTLPLVDGGTTDWARTIDGRNKLTHTVTSGVGTELLAKHFIRRS